MNDANDGIQAVFTDGKASVIGAEYLLTLLLFGFAQVDLDDVHPRRHHRGDWFSGEIEHRLDHLMFLGAKDAGSGSLLKENSDLLSADWRCFVLPDAEQAEYAIG